MSEGGNPDRGGGGRSSRGRGGGRGDGGRGGGSGGTRDRSSSSRGGGGGRGSSSSGRRGGAGGEGRGRGGGHAHRGPPLPPGLDGLGKLSLKDQQDNGKAVVASAEALAILAAINGENTAHEEHHQYANKHGAEREASDMVCCVCTENLNDQIHRPAVGACDHVDTCALCYLRLRRLVGDQSCPMCKAQQEVIFIFESPRAIRPFKALQIWGDCDGGPGTVFDDASRIIMPRQFYQDIFQVLEAPLCRVPNCGLKCRSLNALKDHLRNNHERYLCDVCLENKKAFLGEQALYSKLDLARHRDRGEPSHGFFGHPECRFCKQRYYDTGHLYKHFTEAHYSCDLCEREGIQHKYYRDYPDLERHFRQEHHLCEDPRCLEQRFVVFANPIDFQGHILAAHPEQNVSRKLAMAFRVKGSRGGGGGEENDNGGGSSRDDAASSPSPDSSSAPSSFQMTINEFPDLSQQTARARGRLLPQARDGPTSAIGRFGGGGRFLPPASSSSSGFSGEDFPALPGGGAGGGGTGGGDFLNALLPRGAQIHQDRDRWSYPEVDIGPRGGRAGKQKGKKKKGGGGSATATSVHEEEEDDDDDDQGDAALAGPRPSGGQGLMEEIQNLIGEDAFVTLRDTSRQLRTGALAGQAYYDGVIKLIPSRPIRLRVMADLLDILPDEALKQEIQALIDTRDQRPTSAKARSPSPSAAQSAPAPPALPPNPTPSELLSASSSSSGGGTSAAAAAKKKKKPSAGGSTVNGWGKALASASGQPVLTKVVKGRKPAGLTIVRFSKSANEDEPPPRPVFNPPAGPPPLASASGATAVNGGDSSSMASRLSISAGGGGGYARATSGNFPPLPSSSSSASASFSGQGTGYQNNESNFPSLPVAPPAPARAAVPATSGGGGGWVGKVARDAEEDSQSFGSGKKKKGGKKKVNELQALAFNFK